MAIADDIDFDLANQIMKRKTGAGATVYSANAVYSYVQDTFDELTHFTYKDPMTAQTPTSYTMVEGWYIQEELTKYIDGGAIQTSGYVDENRTLICGASGWTNFVTGDVGNTITGSVTGDTGTIIDYDNTAHKIWVRMDAAGDLFDNASENYTQSGTGAGTATAISTTGEHVFANPYSLGTLEGTPAIYIFQNGEKITSWWAAGHFDILIKVTESGVDIDSKAITAFCRTWTDKYDNFYIVLTTAGQNAIPLGTSDDLDNQTAVGTIEDYQDGTLATVAIGFNFTSPYSYDIGDGNGAQPYNVQVDCDGESLAIVYEVCKYWNRDGSTKQLEQDTDSNFVDGEEYRYAKNTYAEVKPSPLGTFAGDKFFGARGVYFTNLHADDVQAFQLKDANGVTRNPPNYQSFAITGLVSGDRVAIFLESGGSVDKTQYNIKATQSSGVAYVDIGVSIPNDTPTTGTVIVKDSVTGTEDVYAYTSWSGDRFTITGVTSDAYQTADNVFVPYLYEQAAAASASESVIYTSDRNIIAKFRLAGFKPWSTTGVFVATGYSVKADRTTDPQYT